MIDYDQIAGTYDEDRAPFPVPPDVMLQRLVAEGRVRVVDLGCGTGRWLAAQAAAFAGTPVELIGVDPSLGMLSEAVAKGLPRLVRARAEEVPLDDESVDYVFTGFAFHHFADKDRALDEVGRLLRSGGVFHMVNIEPTMVDGWWLHRFFPGTRAIDAARFWDPERIAAALERRGFGVETHIETTSETIEPAMALAEAERRVVSQLASLDDDAYRVGLAELRAHVDSGAAPLESVTSVLRVTASK